MKFNKRRMYAGKFGFKMNNIIYAIFLASLAEKPSYGYSLVEKLEEYGVDSSFVPYGAAYRILRNMEVEGLVVSKWDTSGSGPAKRIYEITDNGFQFLRDWVKVSKKNLELMEKILNKISEVIEDGKNK
ncbi:MAG: helix-turn-helix transcriptional regulator [Caldisericaceae bacterium]|nr:helix-turn-helix transcriptional regulator [Caldisericaceae bacterium]